MGKQLIQMLTKANTKLSSLLFPNTALIITGVVLGALGAFYIGPYLDWVEQLGFRIQDSLVKAGGRQSDMAMDYAVSLVWAGFLGAGIIFSPIRHKDKNMLLWAWFIKCFISLFALLFYEAHYPSDAQGYWAWHTTNVYQKSFMDVLFQEKYAASSTTFIIASYNKIVPDFIKNSYHSLKISFSMVGLMAMYIFYRTSIIITKRENQMIFWALVLFPSLLIWNSRIGKESIMTFSIAVHTAGLVNWHFKRKSTYLFMGLAGWLACAFIRIWIGALLVVPLSFYFLSAQKGVLSKLTCSLLLGILFLPIYNVLLHKLGHKNMISVYKKLGYVAKTQAGGGSAINRAPVTVNGPLDVIKYAPSGIFTALFRPLPWDITGLLGLLSGMEGLLLLYLFFRAMNRTRLKELNDPIVVWGVVLVLSWATLYGFVIYNFGTGLRWKAQILPIFLGLLLYLGRSRSKDLKPFGSKFLNLPELKK